MSKVSQDRIIKLYNKYYNRMIGMAMNILQDRHASADAYNSAFEDLIKYLDKLDFEPNDQHMEALIVQYTKWRSKDEVRKRGRRPETPLIDEKDIVDDIDMADMIIETTHAKEAYEILRTQMNEDHLDIMIMKYCLGHTSRDISQKYNLKENHINQILLRARKKAQKILRSYNE